jgi:hypothetical protein
MTTFIYFTSKNKLLLQTTIQSADKTRGERDEEERTGNGFPIIFKTIPKSQHVNMAREMKYDQVHEGTM